jgi:hypothetical protein
MSTAGFTLSEGMDLAGLDYPSLWIRYVALGGNGTAEDLRRHVTGDSCQDDAEHNVIAQAINEAFMDRGENHPVAYRRLPDPRDE